MKKITLFILTSFLFLSFSSFSQKQMSPASIEEGMIVTLDRSGELDPPANSIFSQQSVGTNKAYYSDDGTPHSGQMVYDDFQGLTTDINGMVFWGILWTTGIGHCYTPGASYDFDISFYQSDDTAVGALVNTFTVTITPIQTDPINKGMLRFDVTFPSAVSLQSGWVSVVRKNPTNSTCTFAWVNTTLGNNRIAWKTPSISMIYYEDDMAFCLTNSQAVPVSNWAIVFGVLLIGLFIAIRYRNLA